MTINILGHMESLLTSVQADYQESVDMAFKQNINAEHIVEKVRNRYTHNQMVYAGLQTIRNRLPYVLNELFNLNPDKKQLNKIRERCASFIDVQTKEVFRLATDRTKQLMDSDNQELNLWFENIYSYVDRSIDAEISKIDKERKRETGNRVWDAIKFIAGAFVGYLIKKYIG
jgi:hypothetical protein